jgi:hypothetical protein
MAFLLLIGGAALCLFGSLIGVFGWMQSTPFKRARMGGASAIAVFSGLAVIALGLFVR